MGTSGRETEERSDAPTHQRAYVTTVGIRDLGRNPSRVIAELIEAGEPVVITNRGRPVAVLTPIDEAELEDHILSHAKQFEWARIGADAELQIGKTHALDDVLADLED